MRNSSGFIALIIFNMFVFSTGWMLSFFCLLQKLNIYSHFKYVGASLNCCLITTIILSICVGICLYVVYRVTKE